jgi:ABC-type transporter Mla subunit MlaD
MKLPFLDPRDVVRLVERGAEAIDLLVGAVPRLVSLIAEAEVLLERVGALVERIEATRAGADDVVRRTDAVVTEAERIVLSTDPLTARLRKLLDATEPSMVRLQPTLERLADTTDPREVDAMVALVDQLPVVAAKLETDVIPVMETLSTVAPDLHDLLEVSRELNEMLAGLPGIGRIKKRIDEEQAEEGED